MPPIEKNTWICPHCGRNFSRKNQFHNCDLYLIEQHHLLKADPTTKALFYFVIETIRKFGPVLLEPLKSIIALKKKSQFCSIHVQIKTLKIQFRNYTQINSLRFNRTSQQGKMYYYEFLLKSQEDFDEELISWLHLAYDQN